MSHAGINGKYMKSTELKRLQVQKLYTLQKGLCYWCHCQMVLSWETIIHRHRRLPDNLATIDHLDSRLSTERGKHNGEYRRVLACQKCNNARGAAEVAALPLEELHRRSGR